MDALCMSHRAERRIFPPLVISFTLLLAGATLKTLTLTPHHPPPAFVLPLYVALVLLVLLTYLSTHLTPPGSAQQWAAQRPDLLHPCAPPHVQPDAEQPPPLCAPCNVVKNARVHHCSVCQRCVLRYDHHCAWLATCIGLFNAKYFLQFLLYSVGASLTTALLHVRFILNAPTRLHSTTVMFVAFVSPVSLSASMVTCGAASLLFVWNVWLMLHNRTALEHLLLSEHKPVVCYNARRMQNLRHLLGWNPLLWLIPVPQSRCPPAKTKS